MAESVTEKASWLSQRPQALDSHLSSIWRIMYGDAHFYPYKIELPQKLKAIYDNQRKTVVNWLLEHDAKLSLMIKLISNRLDL